jgi:pyruvate dehydrogenase E1 component
MEITNHVRRAAKKNIVARVAARSLSYQPKIQFKHGTRSFGNRTPEVVMEDLKQVFTKQGVSCLSSFSAEWFARADQDSSKALDKAEFKAVMESLGLKLSDSEAETLFAHFDKDSGGTVTYGEFAMGLRGAMPEFSAALAFMHQSTGHYKSNMSQIRAARPVFCKDETEEWTESLEAVVKHGGLTRARFLLYNLMEDAARLGVNISQPVVTPLVNTIATAAEPEYPGDRAMEERLSNIIRWNAAVMVSDSNRRGGGVGGHIGTFASICDVMEVGQNHFFRGKEYGGGRGDSIWIQGHAAPGPYARALLEGRLTVSQVMNFRREADGEGISSYPHPRLMPDFWENPTVSMGLGPLGSVYQARFFRYLHLRGLADTSQSRVWAFVGDGESDEPESVTAISVAGRERLNNMIFIVNCNYQRLDGPVRGNSKVIQEYEGSYRGAGFDVIKVVWGGKFNELIEADHDGKLIEALESTPDGDCQRLHAKADGALVRKELFEKHGLLDRVAHWSDEELLTAFQMPGGHDHKKIYAAMKQAENNAEMGGRPTVILVKTLKGYSLQTFLGRNTVHQKKMISDSDMQQYRTTLNIPLTDEQLKKSDAANFFLLGDDSPEKKYMMERRKALGGFLPQRVPAKVSSLVELPGHETYAAFDAGSKGREISTTMTFAQILRNMMKAGEFGSRISLMVTDESRTFGLDAFFPIFKIHAPFGQNYTPVDADQVMKYSEAANGQILQEGISEGGAIMTWIASATSYASQQAPTLPFMIYYSMFGFQRVGDSIWQACDMRARGFLIGGTYGRTTLNGEGLQHQDGHSLLMALTFPAVKGWDPAFGYEMGAIIEHGVKEMWGEDQDVIYYITAYNENMPMPAKPEGVDEGIVKGLYKFQDAKPAKHTVRLIGSGCIMKQALDAVEMLAEYDVGCEIWSATSYGELQREALAYERLQRLGGEAKTPWVAECLGDGSVTVAVSDNMTAWPMIIDPWVGGKYTVLGADGFGRSDAREELRRFFEVDKEHVVVAALDGLAKTGKISKDIPAKAIAKFGFASKRKDICFD